MTPSLCRLFCLYLFLGAVVGVASGQPRNAPLDRLGAPLPARVARQLAAVGVAGRTTLDGRVQRAVDAALDDGLAEGRSAGLVPTGGAAVVLGLRERALLALASAPEEGASRALAAVPAGSVLKPIVALAAIGEGLDPVQPRACPARFTADGSTIRNWRSKDGPALTIAQAIAQSCNTVFAGLAARLWHLPEPEARTAIQRMYQRVGFGIPTGLVPGEAFGRVPAGAATLGDLMVLAIGQGPLAVTPLQVARAYAAIAGSPKDAWRDITGRPLAGPSPPLDDRSLAPVRSGLELAVREGTARAAFAGVALDRVPVAGKTGSAEIGDVTPYAWFAAFAPADHPRYVVTVVIERGRAGAVTAAPIARRILDRLLDLPRVRPRFPFPHPAALLLALPLLAGIAVSPAAGSLLGFAAGAAAAALAFAAAGWIAAMLRVRRAPPAFVAVAAGVGTLGLPAAGWGIPEVLARAGLAAGVALIVTVPLALALRLGARRAQSGPADGNGRGAGGV